MLQERERDHPTMATRANDPGWCGVFADWYVVQVWSQFGTDIKVFKELSKDFRCHLVQEVKRKRAMKHGRPIMLAGQPVEDEMLVPVFPGFLFVSFDLADGRWPLILQTRGVHGILRRAGQSAPCALKPGWVESWQAKGRAGDGAIDDRKPAFPVLAAGEMIRCLDDIYANFQGVVESCDGDKVRAMMSMFGRDVPATLDRANVLTVSTMKGT
jgi:transcription antitermination factor NusG